MSRNCCDACSFPLNACICDAIRPLNHQQELIVMQHPSEVGHAKNSVRLMQLVLSNLKVFVGEQSADFVALQHYLNQCGKPVFLIYPSDDSKEIGQAAVPSNAVFILLDGTWRKAYKLLQLNPWLSQYRALHFDLASASNYTIRKSSRSDSLSTLEAAAMTLKQLDNNLDVTPLTDALAAMVNRRLAAMPAEVRQRYRKSTDTE
ncbi:DTW domain-containing protein [Shewanella sp. Scap07]|uniref:tRNA-uridine aminocarboxypropyltransferase n=1 Tax=Shewanella sp. Scap07 TaxID=2589987 RepID=UPI0015BEB1A5|nr:tRNA-uridine aminocarboxypropyltransferase [Shewanella sp. Scap07]QLE87357.1 DTW domain-containing protein [Shewanella sp. Scap07]